MRESGILLHITSLPSKYGVGSLGKPAYKFVDFLQKSGQKIWQILPIGPTAYGDSPYSSTSAYAINPFFIDLEMLLEEGLIDKEDLKEVSVNRVDFNYLFESRYNLFYKAYERFDKNNEDFIKFKNEEDYWLSDYAEFMVLKNEQENKPWYDWYYDFKTRKEESLNWLKGEFSYKIDYYKFIQFKLFEQFLKLKSYANKRGVSIMGDIPIYCAYDSADVWAHNEYFELDYEQKPVNVAGCPPDFFSPLGQLWGNPLYDWEYLKEKKYNFWVSRVKHSFKFFDILRIDHFRGFAGYYSIPYGSENAINGKWIEGPGYSLFKEIKNQVGNVRIVAENLGFLTPDVDKLLKKCGYPGMKIFQFELGYNNICPIKKGFNSNNLIYTGTHDNQTIMSFYNALNTRDKKIVDKVCNIGFFDRPNLKIIEYSMKSNCDICIVPLQDYLGLSDDLGRMNTPGVALGNWGYISKENDFTSDLLNYIKNLTKESNR